MKQPLYNFLQSVPYVVLCHMEFGDSFEEVFRLPCGDHRLHIFSDTCVYDFEVTSGFFGDISHKWKLLDPEDVPREIVDLQVARDSDEMYQERALVWSWILHKYMQQGTPE